MNYIKFKRGYNKANKKEMLSIRINKTTKDWLDDNNISPTKLFDTSIKRLKK